MTTPSPGGPLATEAQRNAERLALQIVADPLVRAAMASVEAELLEDPVASSVGGRAGLGRAIALWAHSLALREAVGDVGRPAFVWVIDETPRHWLGHDFPGASVGGVANPDNIYRNAFLDGARRYLVQGRRHPDGPATFSLELARQSPGEFMLAPTGGTLEADLGDQLGILTDRDIALDADGGFTITLGPEPADDRRHHLQTVAGALALNHRDTLSDWRQIPNTLGITALDGPPPSLDASPGASLGKDELARRTAAHLPGYVRFWTPFRRQFLGAPPSNGVSAIFPRDGGWGYAAGGRYDLAEDEALVVTTRSGGASYTGMQVSDAWMMVPDLRRQISLNSSQLTPELAGTITYVISARDPGIGNWIDTAGHAQGWFMLRWQDLPASHDPGSLLVSVRPVRLSTLDEVLDPGVERILPAERATRLGARSRSYARRIGQ